MTVGAVPNVVQATRSIRAMLKRITRANGYFTDVRYVEWPDWSEENLTQCLSVDAPALQLWQVDDLLVSGMQRSSDLRPTIEYQVRGVLRVPKGAGLQEQVTMLISDVFGVMFKNQSLDWPDSTVPNTWGIDVTRLAPGSSVRRRYWGEAEGVALGGFDSMWHSQLKAPAGG